MRRGMATGTGKGYKNIVGKDPQVHSNSAKGMKQPQRVAYIPNDKGQAMLREIKYDKGFNEDKEETTFQKIVGRTSAFALKEERKAEELYKKLKKDKEAKEEEEHTRAIDLVKHPKMEKLKQEEEKLKSIESHIATVQDEEKEDELFEQLEEQKEKLNEMKNEIDNIQLEDFSDSELKELAVRHDSANELSLFGSGENKYEKEYLRRMDRRKQLARDIAEKKKEEIVEAKETKLFDF